jgi:hypothetical protein
MARLKKGIWVFHDASGEYDSPAIEGRTTKYREVLVDWLNRAFASTSADRDAAKRVASLMKEMNDTTAEYLKDVESWQSGGERQLGAVPFCKTFQEIASANEYELELDLCPRHGSRKWHLAFHCVTAPSGDAYERYQLSNVKQDPQPLSEEWRDVPRRFNAECQAVNAVVFIALEGRLGTIKQCQVKECRRWFLTKDDGRVRCCPDHDSDDLRRGTEPRKKLMAAAQKRARDRERIIDKKHLKDRLREGYVMPGSRRAKK